MSAWRIAITRHGGGLLLLAAVVSAGGCREETKVDVASTLHPDRMPTMTTRNVSTMISDSGVTQYKIVAPLWKVYDEGDNPQWKFPEGLWLRKYDRKFNVIATIACDSAIYFKNKNLWRLDGRVEVTRVPRALFLSQQMFWDQDKGIVYGDSFIHIEDETHMMEGYGFRARQDFSAYSINRPLGIFPAERNNLKEGSPASSEPRRGVPAPSGSAVSMTPPADPTMASPGGGQRSPGRPGLSDPRQLQPDDASGVSAATAG